MLWLMLDRNACLEALAWSAASQAACSAVKELAVRVGIPQHLSELGITKDDIPALSRQAIEDVCTPGNPRDVDLATIEALYTAVL